MKLTSENIAIKIIQICTIGIFALGLLLLAKIAHADDGARILFYQMTPTVRVAITNDWCTTDAIKKTHPWVAYQFHISQGKVDLSKADAIAVGCFGPLDINDISFIWENEKPFTLPANAFLLPQDLYHREVPQQPEIEDDGTRQDI